jgi:hypothetical protein
VRRYSLSGQDFQLPFSIPELESFAINEKDGVNRRPFVSYSFLDDESAAAEPKELVSQTVGWVAEAERLVEVWSIPFGFLMRVAGGSDFYISSDGRMIQSVRDVNERTMLNELDRQILIGPVLVLVLALRGTWCLHSSAAMFQEKMIVFLGESGQGKSTLAAYLSKMAGWRLVADDILPVIHDAGEVRILPRFPQLKISPESQPCIGLPESVLLKNICVLKDVEKEQEPDLKTITTAQGLQALLSHIAGTRMFNADLLAKHLAFCAQAASQLSFYQLSYPHRKGALPEIQERLRTLC